MKSKDKDRYDWFCNSVLAEDVKRVEDLIDKKLKAMKRSGFGDIMSVFFVQGWTGYDGSDGMVGGSHKTQVYHESEEFFEYGLGTPPLSNDPDLESDMALGKDVGCVTYFPEKNKFVVENFQDRTLVLGEKFRGSLEKRLQRASKKLVLARTEDSYTHILNS